MDSTLVLNIETMPRQNLAEDLCPSMDDIDVPATSKKVKLDTPELIEAYKRNKYRDEMKKLSLSPLTAQIVSLATKLNDQPVQAMTGLDEYAILSFLIDRLIEMNEKASSVGVSMIRMVTFNGKSFDLPHIMVACARHGLVLPLPSYESYLAKYSNTYHVDVRNILTSNNSYAEGTLGDWCSSFNIPRPFGFGNMVGTWAEEGNWDFIERHCSENVDRTYQLFKRIEHFVSL